MTTVDKAYPDMFREIHETLLTDLDPDRPEEEWRSLFDYRWPRAEEHVGYVLRDGTAIVGFIGTIFSHQSIAGISEPHCNVTSWVAKPAFRRDAVALLFPLRNHPEYTVTNLSAEHHVRDVFLRMGYDYLETKTAVMYPPMSPLAFRCPRGVRAVDDPTLIDGLCSAQDARIAADHAPYAHQVVVECFSGVCLGIYTVRRRRRLRTALFHHLTDASAFVEALPGLRRHLWRKHRVVLIECDSRLVAGFSVPSCRQITRPFPRLYQSPRLTAGQVTNLYSETILLNLE